MGKSSRSNRKKALGTERRRHLNDVVWLEGAEARRAEALAKCLAADPVPVPEAEAAVAAAADEMDIGDGRGRQGAAEVQQQSKKKRKKAGMDVDTQPLKKRGGRGSLKGMNQRMGYVNIHQLHLKKRKGKQLRDPSKLWFISGQGAGAEGK